jgi:hypothetical protein
MKATINKPNPMGNPEREPLEHMRREVKKILHGKLQRINQ